MKIKVRHTSYVIGFLDIGFSSESVGALIEEWTLQLYGHYFPFSLDCWELGIMISYGNQNNILLFRKTRSDKDEKYKEIVIHIPIPLNTMVDWGVKPEQHLHLPMTEKILRNAEEIEVDARNFSDLEGYVLACVKSAVDKLFRVGFTVDGIKIKKND